MQEVNFKKERDVEVKINGAVYGFNLTARKIEKFQEIIDSKMDLVNLKDEEEVKNALYTMEGIIEDLFGEEQFDKIFPTEDDITYQNLMALLNAVHAELDKVSSANTKEAPSEVVPLNREQRRAARRKK